MWSDFHDAAIVNVSIKLADQLSTIEVERSEGCVEIVGEGTTLLSCAQQRPWGNSHDVFINEIRYSNAAGDRLEIETQNGDTIVLEAARIFQRLIAQPSPQIR